MNVSFLPGKIKKELKELVADKVPISVVRATGDINGESGEGYVVAYDDKLYLFSRKVGDDGFLQVSGNFKNDVAELGLRKEGYETFLDINLGGKKYAVKCSSFEKEDMEPMLKLWDKGEAALAAVADHTAPDSGLTGQSVPGADTVAPPSKVTPMIGMAAALMYLSNVDGAIAKEEDYYILSTCGYNQQVLQPALAYYKTHTFDELLVAIKNINNEQKLCILANLIELGMSDGVLHSSEQKMIRQFVEKMGMNEDSYQTIRQVMLLKNQLSVLE